MHRFFLIRSGGSVFMTIHLARRRRQMRYFYILSHYKPIICGVCVCVHKLFEMRDASFSTHV